MTTLPGGAAFAAGGPNPDLAAQACGLDFTLVLDTSGSINTVAEQSAVKASANAFLNALKNTGSKVSIVSFDATATLEAAPTPLTTDNLAALQDEVNTLGFSGATNWEAALELARAQSFPGPADLVVVITDGDPTTHNGDGSNSGGDTDPLDLSRAVAQADLLKSPDGTRMFALGVGTSPTTSRLIDISGPDQFVGTDTPPFHQADWMLVTDFGDLESTLTGIATAVCGGTVVVEKLVDDVPAGGWTFSATGAQASPAVTDDLGVANFAHFFPTAQSPAVPTTITEKLEPGHRFVRATCLDGQTEITSDVLSIDLSVTPTDVIHCTFHNTQLHNDVSVGVVGGDPTFALDPPVVPPFILDAGETMTFDDILAGQYTLTMTEIEDGFVLDSITCGDDTVGVPNLVTRSVVFAIEEDGSVACTFTVSPIDDDDDGDDDDPYDTYDDDPGDPDFDFDTPFNDDDDDTPAVEVAGDTQTVNPGPGAQVQTPKPVRAAQPAPDAAPAALDTLPRTGSAARDAAVLGGLILILGGATAAGRRRKATQA